jgi:hypothetical protein
MSALTKILVSRIESQFPKMRKQVADQLEDTREKLDKMGTVLRTDDEKRGAANAAMLKICAVLNSATSGQYDGPLFVEEPMAQLMARIRSVPHATFKTAMAATQPGQTKPDDPWSVESLKVRIASTRGRELPGFLSSKTCQLLIKEAVSSGKEPMQELLNGIRAIVEEVCEIAVRHCTGAHKEPVSAITVDALDVLSARVALLRTKRILKLVEREPTPFTLNPGFIKADQLELAREVVPVGLQGGLLTDDQR